MDGVRAGPRHEARCSATVTVPGSQTKDRGFESPQYSTFFFPNLVLSLYIPQEIYNSKPVNIFLENCGNIFTDSFRTYFYKCSVILQALVILPDFILASSIPRLYL